MNEQSKCGFLILDRKGEYVKDTRDQRGNTVFGLHNHPRAKERMVIVSMDSKFAKMKDDGMILDHLRPQFSIRDIDPIDLADFLTTLTQQQADIVRDYSYIDNFYEKLLPETHFGGVDNRKWYTDFPNLFELKDKGKKLLSSFEEAAQKTDRDELLEEEWKQLQEHTGGTKAPLLSRAATTIKRFCLHPFFGKSSKGKDILAAISCIDQIFKYLADGKFVFIDMLGQNDENYTMVAALFARRLLTRNKELEQLNEEQIRACIVMEEAHNILSEDELTKGVGRGSVFVELAREGRSLKLGFVLVTQQPDVKSIAKEVIKTIDTVVAFNMPPDDAKQLQRLKSGFSGLELEISNAAEFRGVAISTGGPIFFQSSPVDKGYMKDCVDHLLEKKILESIKVDPLQEELEPAIPVFTIEDRLSILMSKRQKDIQEIALASMQPWNDIN